MSFVRGESLLHVVFRVVQSFLCGFVVVDHRGYLLDELDYVTVADFLYWLHLVYV